jgi:hypothetical protein
VRQARIINYKDANSTATSTPNAKMMNPEKEEEEEKKEIVAVKILSKYMLI